MSSFAFYLALLAYMSEGEKEESAGVPKKKLRRASKNYIVKDNQLFYTGPKKTYMRLVVLSDEQRKTVLRECHDDPGTGNHGGVRATRDKVVRGYYWSTINADVREWYYQCHRCQLNDPIKTVPPLLHPIQVNEPWTVLGMDLIGPLRTTEAGHKYVLTVTDLFTKWVMAEPLQAATATAVATALVGKLYLFGLVKKIISDQGREFVNGLNQHIFSALGIQHAVSSAYHPQTNGQDERTNQNLKRALRRYVNEDHNNWDIHLQAIVYGINVSKQRSTCHSPYYLMFHRQPHLPAVLNACSTEEDNFVVGDPEDHIQNTIEKVKALNEKVHSNIKQAQAKQKKTFEAKKRKNIRQCVLEAGDAVLIGETPLKRRKGNCLQPRHQGPFTMTSVTNRGVATIKNKDGKLRKINVSRLRPYKHPKDHKNDPEVMADHQALTVGMALQDHLYASKGPRWSQSLGPNQEQLMNYVLDRARPATELIVLDGPTCVTREDFWSLGLGEQLESNIGNACFRIIEEEARRNGMQVHVANLYNVATWKQGETRVPDNLLSKDAVVLPAWSDGDGGPNHYMLCVLLVSKREALFLDSLCPNGFGDKVYQGIFRRLAQVIAPGPWVEKHGADFTPFPVQSDGTSCGIFMLMYAFCLCTGAPFDFETSDIPQIRKWWCVQLMERFSIQRQGQDLGRRFAYWTEEAKQLLDGTLPPTFRVKAIRGQEPDGPLVLRDLPRAVQWLQGSCHQLQGRVHEPSFLKLEEEDKEEAIKNLYENEFTGVDMEPFSFHFEHPEDMEGFLRECRDNQKMVVYTTS